MYEKTRPETRHRKVSRSNGRGLSELRAPSYRADQRHLERPECAVGFEGWTRAQRCCRAFLPEVRQVRLLQPRQPLLLPLLQAGILLHLGGRRTADGLSMVAARRSHNT